MTISTTTIKNSYSGNGVLTVFAYTFKIATTADIEVIIRSSTGSETVKDLTTHYSVSGAGSASGGNVTMGTPPATGETLVIRRATTQTQAVDLVENDPFTADSVEGAFDKNLRVIEEALGIEIKNRGNIFLLSGATKDLIKGEKIINDLYINATTENLSEKNIHLLVRKYMRNHQEQGS